MILKFIVIATVATMYCTVLAVLLASKYVLSSYSLSLL